MTGMADDAVARILDGLAVPERNGDQPADDFASTLYTSAQIAALPPPAWLIDGYLVRDSLALLYGPSGAAKTFLAIDWTLHLATGSWWNRRQLEAGEGLYVIAEGATGVGRRLDAWQTHHGVYDLAKHRPVMWLPQAVNLTDLPEVAALCDYAAQQQPALIVADTLARCTVGADENSARDMGLVVARLDRIRRASGACVLVVHHTGKDGTAGARGSSALRAAVDTEIEITATDERVTVRVTKQKDGAEPLPLHLTRTTVNQSCVLVPARAEESVSAGALRTLESLRRIEVPGGVPATAWQCGSDVAVRTFYEHRSQLVREGLVRNIGTDRSPRYTSTTREDADE